MWSVLFFILISVLGFGLAFRNFKKIYAAIQLGKDEMPIGDKALRWKNVVLIAFGQKKMFKLTIPALLHLFIYVAFLITQVELLEILVDGLLNTHRAFSPFLGGFYDFIISFLELLSLLAFVATVAFLWRRNVLKVKRFQSPELKSWPFRDANIILIGEIALLIGVFSMNGAEQTLAAKYGINDFSHSFAVSTYLMPAILGGFSENSLHLLERAGWWLHYLVVLGFLNYLPVSKHLHIFLAFIHTYFARLNPRGEMENIPVITNEVKSMLGLPTEQPSGNADTSTEFGVKDIFQLPKRVLLSAYSCTECGRCTAVCPANITGKKLSPRKIMMDIRDRCEEVSSNINTAVQSKEKYDDGKSLFNYIGSEELYACTACNACVEACPILINPLEPILEMRRYEILTESKGPAEWTAMFTSLENNGSVWAMSESRAKWSE
jgi:heterodisulfide reductase subunit C